MRFVADPSDRLALACVLRGPLVGLSDAALAALLARPATLEDVLDPPSAVRATLAADDRERLDDARATLRRLVRFGTTLGPSAVLRLALAERGYAAVLAGLPFAAQRVANVDKLVGLATAAEQRRGEDGDVAGFVRFVDRMRAAGQREAEADVADVATGAVQILSIHAAKGLEWPVVFVAQTSRRRKARAERILIDGARRVAALPAGFHANEEFRSLRQDAHAAEDDDQRRLLYVALTRGRDVVVVSGPRDEGEGDWRTLSVALAREAPQRVRVLRPGDVAPALAVRAGGGTLEAPPASPEALAHALEAPRVPRRRLAIAPRALAEFELCPRRYHALYELGLDEHPRGLPGAPAVAPRAVEAALRDVLRGVDFAVLARDVDAAVGASLGALGASHSGAALEAAAVLARSFGRSPLARALAAGDAVMARGLPVAVALGGAHGVALHGVIDLLARGEVVGRPGLLVIEYALGPRRPGVDDDGSLAAGAGALALERTFVASGQDAVQIDAAVVHISAHTVEVTTLDADARPAPAAFEARVLALGDALATSGADARWDARPRGFCERIRCGLIPRCHAG